MQSALLPHALRCNGGRENLVPHAAYLAASPRTPRATSLRILSAAWWIAILVLMNSFAGQLRACLMVKNDMKKIDSMADIAAMPKLRVYVLKDSSNSRYLQVCSKLIREKRCIWKNSRNSAQEIFSGSFF
ncbi:hypothetical protein HPB48_026336 [Haemaphysalis longicornis]|uniref:Ionotropic glutamate receptor C-terminal domain-containing protein n=1 Tax=Haemaphysalis longicornis TaxID=44386 RepID=A0A9J6H9A1_HAELO|nr:hypothetical protein HPB48_026336 [Haemaphysalis longicornis]